MSDRVVRLVDGHLVLVSEPADFRLQAIMSGVLELSDGYLRLRDGDSCRVVLLPEDVEVVETPTGPVFHMFDSEYRVGDRVRSGGGTIDAAGHPVPAGSGLTPDTLVDMLQGEFPRMPSWTRRLLDRLGPGHRGRRT